MIRPRIAIIGDRMRDIDQHTTYVKDHEGVPVYGNVDSIERSGGSLSVAGMCSELGADVLSIGLNESIKRRVFIDGVISFRLDDDRSENPTELDCHQWKKDIAEFNADLILICDHAKGVVTRESMNAAYAAGVPVYVDPCVRSNWNLFRRADCISANRDEWANATTQGIGMTIRRLDKDGISWDGGQLPSTCKKVIDTVGAGDQFLSVLAVMRASGHEWKEAITAANYAAGLQCERMGIIPVRREEISSLLGSMSLRQT